MKEKTSTRPIGYAGNCNNPQNGKPTPKQMLEAKKANAILLFKNGNTMEEVGRLVGVTRQTISKWIKEAKQEKKELFEFEKRQMEIIIDETSTILYSFVPNSRVIREYSTADIQKSVRYIASLLNEFPLNKDYGKYSERARRMLKVIKIAKSVIKAVTLEIMPNEKELINYVHQINDIMLDAYNGMLYD